MANNDRKTQVAIPTIVKATVKEIPAEQQTEWRQSRCTLEDIHCVDRLHLVFNFSVNHASTTVATHSPPVLTKYVDIEDHAPYCSQHLKLATLRYYREQHPGLEGASDPMEGRIIAKSSFREFCNRHSVSDVPHVPTAFQQQQPTKHPTTAGSIVHR